MQQHCRNQFFKERYYSTITPIFSVRDDGDHKLLSIHCEIKLHIWENLPVFIVCSSFSFFCKSCIDGQSQAPSHVMGRSTDPLWREVGKQNIGHIWYARLRIGPLMILNISRYVAYWPISTKLSRNRRISKKKIG